MRDVGARWQIWVLGLCSTALYTARFAVEAWVATYFAEKAKLGLPAGNSDDFDVLLSGATDGGAALARRAYTELMVAWQGGGFVGALVAGPASDRLCGGRRMPGVLLCGATLVWVFAAALPALGAGSPAWRLRAAGLLGGTCVFGARTLLVLSTREQVPLGAGGKADAIVNLLGEVGGVLAGLPMIRAIERAGSWTMFGHMLAAAALALLLLCAPLFAAEARAFSSKAMAAKAKRLD
jgi:sugar phosphate permease